MENNSSDLALMEDVVSQAGRIALKYFKAENEVWMKSGNSPVSQADLEVNDYLFEKLRKARPSYGWISEETEDNAERLSCERVFVVDPIDGTRGFINGMEQWCICVAIVENGRPVAAILECPALGERYCAIAGGRSTMNGKTIDHPTATKITNVTASKKLNELISEKLNNVVQVTDFVPSLAYRIAMVSTGAIDVAFARPGAHEWDLAAADLILTCTGGALVNLQGELILYNQNKLHLPALLASTHKLQKPALELANSAGILQ